MPLSVSAEAWHDGRAELARVDHSGGWPGRSGYAGDGVAYCVDCVPESVEVDENAILRGEEWDAPGPTCDRCHDPLDVTLLIYPETDVPEHLLVDR
jgi:hypothetical protein